MIFQNKQFAEVCHSFMMLHCCVLFRAQPQTSTESSYCNESPAAFGDNEPECSVYTMYYYNEIKIISSMDEALPEARTFKLYF